MKTSFKNLNVIDNKVEESQVKKRNLDLTPQLYEQKSESCVNTSLSFNLTCTNEKIKDKTEDFTLRLDDLKDHSSSNKGNNKTDKNINQNAENDKSMSEKFGLDELSSDFLKSLINTKLFSK